MYIYKTFPARVQWPSPIERSSVHRRNAFVGHAHGPSIKRGKAAAPKAPKATAAAAAAAALAPSNRLCSSRVRERDRGGSSARGWGKAGGRRAKTFLWRWQSATIRVLGISQAIPFASRHAVARVASFSRSSVAAMNSQASPGAPRFGLANSSIRMRPRCTSKLGRLCWGCTVPRSADD